MKIRLLVFILFLLDNGGYFSLARSLDKEINAAKEAKKKYDGNREEYGIERVKAVMPNEKRFSRILQWIFFEQICLSRNNVPTSSCYALSDFDIDPTESWKKLESWLSRPYTNDKEATMQWYERLYNSVANILMTEGSSNVALLLGTGSGHGVGERSEVKDIGIGNSQTFSKGFITGNQLNQKLKLDVARSLEDLDNSIEKVLKLIENASNEQ